MRINFRVIGIVIGILSVTLLPCSAKADSFSFSFQGPTDSGSGTFFTTLENMPAICPPATTGGWCYVITGITGQLDGQDITSFLPLGDALGLITPNDQIITQSGVGFGANSQNWDLACGIGGLTPCLSDQIVLFPIIYHDSNSFYDFDTGPGESIRMTLTPIPEPSTLLLLGTGLLCLMACSRTNSRKSSLRY
jgi:hypothetical protein